MPAARVLIPNSIHNMIKRKSQQYATEYIRRAVRMAADYAKANHPYKDRTHNLTKSIQSVPTKTGAYLSARMFYGSFVEWGTVKNKPYPYLRPAIEFMLKMIRNKRELSGITFEKTLWHPTKHELDSGDNESLLNQEYETDLQEMKIFVCSETS